jgi:hypothetical protein
MELPSPSIRQRKGGVMPKWATPIRQLYLAKLLTDYFGKSGWKLDLATGDIYHPEFETKAKELIAHWSRDDRAQRQAEWEAERRQLHSLGERRYPLRGQFSTISQDIFFAEQPQHYLEGLGISGLTFKPFAKVRIASSYMRLFVDLGDALKGVSKTKKRKAIRYGKALPPMVQKRIELLCSLAVRHYLNNR